MTSSPATSWLVRRCRRHGKTQSTRRRQSPQTQRWPLGGPLLYDLIPSDLATYGSEAKRLLQDLQSRNERMFLVTFLVVNTADSQRQLDNNVFQASSIAQKHNCQLVRLDFQQEEALMSSLPLGLNQIEIQRSLTTSSTAIFVPFTTEELFQSGNAALYYGLNALSNNLIMVDRKLLKNPKGVYRKGTGTPRKQQAVRPQAAQGRGKGRAKVILTVVYHRQPNMERGLILCQH